MSKTILKMQIFFFWDKFYCKVYLIINKKFVKKVKNEFCIVTYG